MLFEECEFSTKSGVIRGKRWGRKGGVPVMALHGWLDNCASFDLLAPLLNNVDFVALDLAGNGISDFREGGGRYNIWSDLPDIAMIKEALGWEAFTIVGHSKGAMIGLLYAGVFPAHVEGLVCLDAFCPEPQHPQNAPAQLAAAIEAGLKKHKQKRSLYGSYQDAVEARIDGMFTVSEDDASVLAKRGVVEEGSGFYWRFDPDLLLPSDIKFTKAQLEAFIARIPFPVLLLVANNGIAEKYKEALAEVKQLSNVRCRYLDGGHHFHMTENASMVASHINGYLK